MPFHMSVKQGSYAFIKHIPWQFQDSSTTKLYYSMTQIFSMADHTSSTQYIGIFLHRILCEVDITSFTFSELPNNFFSEFHDSSMTFHLQNILSRLFTYNEKFCDFSHTMKNSRTFHIQWKIPGLFTYNDKMAGLFTYNNKMAGLFTYNDKMAGLFIYNDKTAQLFQALTFVFHIPWLSPFSMTCMNPG